MKKNVSGQFISAEMVSATDGSAVTSGTTTCYVMGDGGSQTAGSVGSGACTHKGNGLWTYAPAQAETNYNQIAYTFVNSAAINSTVLVDTTFPQAGDSFATAQFLPSVAAGSAGGLLIAGTNAATTITGGLTTTFTGNLTGSVGSLASQAQTDVKTQIVAALNTDTYAEPAQGAPVATTTLAAKISHLYKAYRNKKTQTSSTWSLYADDGVTVDQKSPVSDDGTTATRSEIVSGP